MVKLPVGKVPMFQAEWFCLCGSVIEYTTQAAMVDSQTGAYMHCRHCGQGFIVRRSGAQPVVKESEDASEPTTAYRLENLPGDPDVAVPQWRGSGRISAD